MPRNGRASVKILPSELSLRSCAEPSSVTSGVCDKLLALCQLALHETQEYLIQSEGTKLCGVWLLPDLSILKQRFEPESERKNSYWMGIVQWGCRNLGCNS